MKTELLVKELPFEIPVEELTKISGIKDLSSKLNLIRRWVHFNQDITHEKRLIWHQSVVDLAKKNKLLELEARSLGNIAKIYDRLGQFDHSLTSSKIAEKIWIKLSRDDNKYLHNLIITYCDLAVTYRLENKIEEAFEILYKGYKIIKNNGSDFSSSLIILSSDLGIIYEKIKDYPAALNMYNNAIDLINSLERPEKNQEVKIICIINIGNIYKLTGDYKLAHKMYTKAVNLTNQYSQFYQHRIIANINLGQILHQMSDYVKSIEVYKKVLPVCKNAGSNMDLGFIYILLAEVYLDSDNLVDYRHCIKNGKKKILDAGFANDILYLNNVLKKFYLKNSNYKKALEILNKSASLCKKHNLTHKLIEVYKNIFEIYDKEKDIINALKFTKKYIKCKDEQAAKDQNIFLNIKQQSLNRMQEEIELIKQKEHQNFLKIRLEYKNREISSKKLNSVYNREFIIKLLKNIEKVKENNSSLDEVIKLCRTQMNILSTWKDYLLTYEQVNPNFMNSISNFSNKLSNTEIRVCTLIHLGLDNYEISELMSISKRSVEQHRYRIKKKLEVDINLTKYLLSL